MDMENNRLLYKTLNFFIKPRKSHEQEFEWDIVDNLWKIHTCTELISPQKETTAKDYEEIV
jgi:hypothetical protein